MKPHLVTLSVPFIFALSACAPTATDPLTLDDLAAAVEIYENAEGLSTTTSANMPTSGTATYTGHMSTLDSASEGIIGDMMVEANFSTSAVTGTVDNIGLVGTSNNTDIVGFPLDGELTIENGMISGTGINGDLLGSLTGTFVNPDDTSETADVTIDSNLVISGDFLSSNPGTADADIIHGNANGDFDVAISFDGDEESDTLTLGHNEVGFTVCTSDCGDLINP